MAFTFDSISVRDAAEVTDTINSQVIERNIIGRESPTTSSDLFNWNIKNNTGTFAVDTINTIRGDYVWKYTESTVILGETRILESEFFLDESDLDSNFSLSMNYVNASVINGSNSTNASDMFIVAQIENHEGIVTYQKMAISDKDSLYIDDLNAGFFNLNFTLNSTTTAGINNGSYKLKILFYSNNTDVDIDFRFNNVILKKCDTSDYKANIHFGNTNASQDLTTTSNVNIFTTNFQRTSVDSNIFLTFTASIAGTSYLGILQDATSTGTGSLFINIAILDSEGNTLVTKESQISSRQDDTNDTATFVPAGSLNTLFTADELNITDNSVGPLFIVVSGRVSNIAHTGRIRNIKLVPLEL